MTKQETNNSGRGSKIELHPRNKHRERYDLDSLCKQSPELKNFVFVNHHGNESIDFFDPNAVKALNQALLKSDYGVEYWDLPEGYLCPPIPGRVDYLHYVADLLAEGNSGVVPKGSAVRCFDLGVGANCIYPLLGLHTYGWNFVGSDSDPDAIVHAQGILDLNPHTEGKIDLRFQRDKSQQLQHMIHDNEFFDLLICNPPFHASEKEMLLASRRKLNNLTAKKNKDVRLNFGGQHNELWCNGGEKRFIGDLIYESRRFKKQVYWFTTLVSKQEHLASLEKTLHEVGVSKQVIIPMSQGHKSSRILAWSFQQ